MGIWMPWSERPSPWGWTRGGPCNWPPSTRPAISGSSGGGGAPPARPGQIITRRVDERPRIARHQVVTDTERDSLKAAVVERHRATGNIGLGMVRGFGLMEGALASSIAPDSHNIVAVGVKDEDLYA